MTKPKTPVRKFTREDLGSQLQRALEAYRGRNRDEYDQCFVRAREIITGLATQPPDHCRHCQAVTWLNAEGFCSAACHLVHTNRGLPQATKQ